MERGGGGLPGLLTGPDDRGGAGTEIQKNVATFRDGILALVSHFEGMGGAHQGFSAAGGEGGKDFEGSANARGTEGFAQGRTAGLAHLEDCLRGPSGGGGCGDDGDGYGDTHADVQEGAEEREQAMFLCGSGGQGGCDGLESGRLRVQV